MKTTRIAIISGIFLVLFVAVPVSSAALDSKVPARYGSASKDSVLEKISTMRENNLYSSYQARLIQSLIRSTSQTPISISESIISGSGTCTTCSGVTQYTLINQYSSVPAYFPDATQSSSRGFGTLVVVGPDDGNTYYLWIKSQFFALDVAEGYNMRWHGCNSLPVIYENNILSGTYCLKVTTGPTIDSGVVWCGTAEVASNMTTTVRVLLTPCPMGCSCC
ncbi:MAG: hypothetical protein QHH04_08000 [Methanolinea sp.]|jgi:hypothetical protein|nr:hypothetical protein [Methanolinea sp.]